MLHSPVQSKVLDFIGNLTPRVTDCVWQNITGFSGLLQSISGVARGVAKLSWNSSWPRPLWIWNAYYYNGPAVTDDLLPVFVLNIIGEVWASQWRSTKGSSLEAATKRSYRRLAWSVYPAYGYIQLKGDQVLKTKADNGSVKLSWV